MGSLYRAQHFLTPESILYLYKSTIRPCMEYCSHIWGGAPWSHVLDLLDRVKKRVVSLVADFLLICKPCHTGGMLLASACSTSITMGNVPLSLWISYLPNVSLLEVRAFLSRCIITQLILLCAGLSFIFKLFSSHDSHLELTH